MINPNYVKKYFAGAVEEASPKPNFMLQFFAGTPWTFNDRYIELNKSFIKAKAAPYVNPYVNGKKIEKEGYDKYNFTLPTVKAPYSIDGVELDQIMIQEHIYSMTSDVARAMALANALANRIVDRIANRREVAATEALFNGTLAIVGEGEDRIIDFNRNSSNVIDLLAGNYWNEATSDPAVDFLNALAICARYGAKPRYAIARPSVMLTLIRNAKVAPLVQNMNGYNFGAFTFESRMEIGGGTYYGMFMGVQLWGYEGVYYDDDASETMKYAVPDKKVLFLSPEENNIIANGLHKDLHLMFPSDVDVTKSSDNLIMKMKLGDSLDNPTYDLLGVQTTSPMVLVPNRSVVMKVLA